MAKMTYSQVLSAASAELKKYRNECNKPAYALVYKDAGGDFQYKLLNNPCTVVYTSIKALLYIDGRGAVYMDKTREGISRSFETMIPNINLVYLSM